MPVLLRSLQRRIVANCWPESKNGQLALFMAQRNALDCRGIIRLSWPKGNEAVPVPLCWWLDASLVLVIVASQQDERHLISSIHPNPSDAENDLILSRFR
jgi:hypothetical protein